MRTIRARRDQLLQGPKDGELDLGGQRLVDLLLLQPNQEVLALAASQRGPEVVKHGLKRAAGEKPCFGYTEEHER